MKSPIRPPHLAICLAAVSTVALLTALSFVADDRAQAAPEAAGVTLLADSAICRSPLASAPAMQRLRLASVRTGVSPMGRAPMDPGEFADSVPPLWEGLGALTYKVTTKNPEAQKFFDQGLRLAFAFNHAEAQRAFRHAQRLDADCAMCFWGEALVLGPNINMPMMPEAAAPAMAALTKAQVLAERAGAREQALIAALAERYSDDPNADRKALDAAYATAMGKVAQKYPDDDEIATLHAEALMNLSPWDYWQPGGSEPHPHAAGIVPELERVLTRNPDHPGAIHYYIHAVEASDRPERAEAYADRLRGAMPAAGHLVHMPSHIYYRVGRYRDALDVNIEAVKADEAYLAESNAPLGVYRLGYYPHNVHFVLASAQMMGDGATVIDAAQKLAEVVPDAAARDIALVQPVKAAPYFAHAMFSPPDAVLALADPGNDIPFVKAMWHYARGIARIASGDIAGGRTEAEAIAAIDRSADFSALTEAGIPSNEVLHIAMNVIHGRALQAEANYNDAIGPFEKAAALQAQLPYMEPPYWYYPVRQSLGAVLLQAGRPDDAEREFGLALEQAPNNAWVHYGMMELAKARGDDAAMAAARAKLERSWVGDSNLLSLSRL